MEVIKLNNLYSNRTLENTDEEIIKQQKSKAREKRMKQKQRDKEKQEQEFNFDTETVIGMTNKNNARAREELQKKMYKQERMKQRKKKRIKKILKWTTILGLLMGGTTFALVSPIFNIQEIQVVGNVLLQPETIISLSGLSKEQNIFRFVSQQIEEKVKENPYVQTAKVSRIFPSTVQIEVIERERDFNIEFMNGYAYINKQGYILEVSDSKLDVPVIQGITTPEENIVPGNRLQSEDLEKLETVIEMVSLWKTNGIEQNINSIDITNKNEYSLYIEQEKKKIYLGDKSNLNNKILWVEAIMNDNKEVEGEIYVNGELNGNFRPRFKQKV